MAASAKDACDWVHFAEHPPVRRFPTPDEAGEDASAWILLDNRWTRALAAALPASVPGVPALVFAAGHVCGVPLIALTSLPLLCFSLTPSSSSSSSSSAAAATSTGFMGSLQGFVGFSSSNNEYAAYVAAYGAYATLMWLAVYYSGRKDVLGRSYLVLPSLAGTIGLLRLLGAAHGDDRHTPFDMFCLFLIGWCWCSVLAFLGKTFFLRLRPAARIAAAEARGVSPSSSSCLSQKTRKRGVFASDAWASFTNMHAEGKNREHSFPSFDAACAGCLVATVWVAEFSYLLRAGVLHPSEKAHGDWQEGLLDVVVASLFNVPASMYFGLGLAMYGRVYFLAHHLLDVVCGAIMGFFVTSFVGLALRLEIATGIYHLGSFFGRQVGPQDAFTTPLNLGDRNVFYRALDYLFDAPLPANPTGFGMDLVWMAACVIAIVTFFFVKNVGPFVSVALLSVATALLPRIAWGGIAGTAIVANLFMLQFQLQSEAHKEWVVATLRRFYGESGTAPPPHLVMRGRDGAPQFGDNLVTLLKDKRTEFFAQASEEGGWPGNLYVMHQFRGSLKKGANERRKKQGTSKVIGEFYDADNDGEDRTYLVCTWHRLDLLLNKRLRHFLEVTKTSAADYDVVVGIYSGGALLAPLLTRQLRDSMRAERGSVHEVRQGVDLGAGQEGEGDEEHLHDLCFIKCSRYKSCNMDPISLTKVTLEVALGMHDSQYSVSKPPPKEQIEGKRVLMIDDASVSGGTFRAVEEYLRDKLGAVSVRGLALCDFDGKTHVYDPSLEESSFTAQKLDVGSFTPWGTF